MSESKREKCYNMRLSLCDQDPASSPSVPHVSAQALAWTPRGLGGGEDSFFLTSILPLSLLPLSPSWAQPAGWVHSAKFDLVYLICPSRSPSPILA